MLQTKCQTSFFLYDHWILETVNDFLDLLDDIFSCIVLLEGHLHMLPNSIKVLLLDGHVLMSFVHISPFVLVGSSEQHRQKVLHEMVEIGYLADVLDVEDVKFIIIEDVLIKFTHYSLKNFGASEFVVDGLAGLGHKLR